MHTLRYDQTALRKIKDDVWKLKETLGNIDLAPAYMVPRRLTMWVKNVTYCVGTSRYWGPQEKRSKTYRYCRQHRMASPCLGYTGLERPFIFSLKMKGFAIDVAVKAPSTGSPIPTFVEVFIFLHR